MFCLCVKKSNKKRQFHKRNLALLPSKLKLTRNRSTSTFAGVYTKFTRTRDQAHMPRCTFAPPAQAARNQESRKAPCAAQWCCTTGRWSLLPLPLAHTFFFSPPVEPLHHSNPPHGPGSNFRRTSCRNTLFCSFWDA